MTGRIENSLKIDASVKKILENLPDYMKEYYSFLSASKEPSGCRDYIRKIRSFLRYINENPYNISFEDFSSATINEYIKSIRYKNKNGKLFETSNSYKSGIWFALNNFFKYLVKAGYMEFNPMDAVEKPRGKDIVSKKVLSPDEINETLFYVRCGCGTERAMNRNEKWKHRDLLIMILLFNTGMRETALSEINVEDINFEDKTLKIIDKRHIEHEYPLSEDILKIINIWIKDRTELLNGKEQGALLISSLRERLCAKAISNIVKKYTFAATGTEYSPHKIRATFGTLLYNETNDIEFVREAMGHASISTTQIYVVSKEKDARKKASDIISKQIIS